VKTKQKLEFGDFQTPPALAQAVCALLARRGVSPATIIEPTCGEGNLLIAAIEQFPEARQLYGLEINSEYIARVEQKLQVRTDPQSVRLMNESFFRFDWESLLETVADPVLVVGNPPWVTNAELGSIDSENLPRKSNIHRLKGIDALTGKSNFDISEWMLIQILHWLSPRRGTLAMLCKTAVARKVLSFAWREGLCPAQSSIWGINAIKHFNAAVDACLLLCEFSNEKQSPFADVYIDLSAEHPQSRIGLREGQIVADFDGYEVCKSLQSLSKQPAFVWRSGVKHDCSSVMELRSDGKANFVNKAGVQVEIEPTHLFPMLKSSQVAKRETETSENFMLITQCSVGQDTSHIQHTSPLTWQYLQSNRARLSERRSTIYRNQPPFAIFGVGDYSFAPWKVAISGFYKKLEFAVVGSYLGKPIVFDDTVYFLPCRTRPEADLLASLLNSNLAKKFFSTFVFWDAKRPITVDLLKRIDMQKLARELGKQEEFAECLRLRGMAPLTGVAKTRRRAASVQVGKMLFD